MTVRRWQGALAGLPPRSASIPFFRFTWNIPPDDLAVRVALRRLPRRMEDDALHGLRLLVRAWRNGHVYVPPETLEFHERAWWLMMRDDGPFWDAVWSWARAVGRARARARESHATPPEWFGTGRPDRRRWLAVCRLAVRKAQYMVR